jgi:hypothetical protein
VITRFLDLWITLSLEGRGENERTRLLAIAIDGRFAAPQMNRCLLRGSLTDFRELTGNNGYGSSENRYV